MKADWWGRVFRRIRVVTIWTLCAADCLSANPAADIAHTASLANERKGVEESLADLWGRSWQDRSLDWDENTPLDVDTAVVAALRNCLALRRNLANVAAARANLSQASLPPNPVVIMDFEVGIDAMAGEPLFVQIIQQLTWLWTLGNCMDENSALLQASIFEAAH